MKVVIVWEPDDDCVDPNDVEKAPRRHAEILEDDVVVVWRDPGRRTHFVLAGVFENVRVRRLMRAVDRL